MTASERNLILYKALEDVCKVLRQHPIDMDWYLEDMKRIAFLSGGAERDPEGKEIMVYFINEVIKREGI